MGFGLALFGHLVLYAILAIVLSLTTYVVRRSLRIRNPVLRRVLFMSPFFVAGIPIAVFIGSIAWLNFAPPSYLYRSIFDRPADIGVSHLQGRSEAINDAQEVFLSFADTEQALSQALTTGHFVPLGRAENIDIVPMPGDTAPPQWWGAGHCLDREVFEAVKLRQWDNVVVTQCRSDNRIYVQARWVG